MIPVTILKKVEEFTGKPIWQSFDLIAGTSTGGLIACALTVPNDNNNKVAKYTLDDIMDIYVKRGKEIFPPPKNWLAEKISSMNNMSNPKYSDKGVQKVFSDVLGQCRINDSLTHIIVSTYDLNNNIPLFFKSRSARVNQEQNVLFYDICRATSAAPTYLPAYEFQYPNDNEDPLRLCIDGGVYINNPSLAALAEFSKNKDGYGEEYVGLEEIDYDHVHVLSIGTGTYSGKITADQARSKGQLFWATRISDVMMRGVNSATHYEMNQIMEKGNYLRLSMDIYDEKFSAMDNASPQTLNYILDQTRIQVTESREQMDKLKTWISNAGISSAAAIS